MKRVFIVTGANGFLGNNIVKKLSKNSENEIRALSFTENKKGPLKGLNCKVFKGDVTNLDSLDEIFNVNKNDELYVIHCASIVYIKSAYDSDVYKVNVQGTNNIIDKSIETGAKLVYISSTHAIPEKPKGEVITEVTDFDKNKVNGLYAKTKAEAAKNVLDAVKNRGLNACIVHPSGIIGPNDFKNSHLTQMVVDSAKGSLSACVKGGYDFVDVRDVADGAINACEKGKKGECYILSNKYVEIEDLINMVRNYIGKGKIKTVLPMWFAKSTARLAEAFYNMQKKKPLYTPYSLYALESNALFSHKKADEELEYKTRPIEETVKDTIDDLLKRKIIKINSKVKTKSLPTSKEQNSLVDELKVENLNSFANNKKGKSNNRNNKGERNR